MFASEQDSAQGLSLGKGSRMDTLLVRMKAYAPRRGLVLKCFTFSGIKFLVERGWYRVSEPVGDYLRTVRCEPRNPDSPLAFDVCTDDGARAIDVAEAKAAAGRHNSTDDLTLSAARGERTFTTADLAGGGAPPRANRPYPPPVNAPPPAAPPPQGPASAPPEAASASAPAQVGSPPPTPAEGGDGGAGKARKDKP